MNRARVRAIDRLSEHEEDTGREELLAQILCGDVSFDGQIVRDPKEMVAANSAVAYRAAGFVGRGGIKLDFALKHWDIDITDKVVLDAGASTGGFTHALLLRGATAVHAVDVGYNQLDYRLRVDPRVIVHERTNVMDLSVLDPPADFAVCDLSFRSLGGAAAKVLELASERRAIMLLKPQFEWRGAPESFDGCVPEENVAQVVDETLLLLEREGVRSLGIVESPIRGRRGNREFLVFAESQAL